MFKAWTIQFLAAGVLLGCQATTGQPRVIDARETAQSQPILFTSTPTDGPVDVQLICEQSAVVPGETFRVGLVIRHDVGYHTYWRFPGVIGLATSVNWKLPAGFKPGPLQWAHPQKTKMAVYTVWGYEQDTLLVTDVRAPESVKPGQMFELRADAQWMACARDCNPGYKSFFLRIPVAHRATKVAAWTTMFEKTSGRWPDKTDAWSFQAEATKSGFRLVGTPKTGGGRNLTKPYFFNSNMQIDSNQPQRVERDSAGRLIIHLKRWEYAERVNRLEGILECAGSWVAGEKRPSIRISAPVVSSP